MCLSAAEGGRRCPGKTIRVSITRNRKQLEQWTERVDRAKKQGATPVIVEEFTRRQQEVREKVTSLTHDLEAIEAQHEAERRVEAERKRLDTRTVATLVSNDDYAFIEREAERRGLRSISALIQAVAVEDPRLLPARTQLELASKKFTSSEGGRPPADPSKRREKNLKAKCSTAMRASLEDEAALFDLKVSDYLTNLLRGQDPRTRGGHIAAAKAEKSAREMRKKEEEAGVTNGDEAAAFWQQSVRHIRRAHGLIE